MSLSPDAVLLNGRIMTLDPDLPQVEALAVLGGRVVARGSWLPACSNGITAHARH